jgi:hypothetical protein
MSRRSKKYFNYLFLNSRWQRRNDEGLQLQWFVKNVDQQTISPV